MHDRFRELIKPRHHLVIGVLTLAFFLAFFVILKPFVPAHTAFGEAVGSAYTAAILTAVFWVAAYMFALVWSDEQQRKASSRR